MAYPKASKSSKKRPLTLDDIPPHVREEIFTTCVEWPGEYDESGHEMPALLLVLRGHYPLNMYIQVLGIIYKQNAIRIEPVLTSNPRVWCHSAIAQIQSLSLGLG
jgi:hypothetical protein